MSNEEKWRGDCREAIKADNESGRLATNQYPDHIREAHFRAGYLAGRKAGQEEIDNLTKEHSQIVCAYCNSLCARNTEELVKHVEGCEKHPLGKAIKEIQKRDELLEEIPYIFPLGEHHLVEKYEEWLKQYEELKR